MSRLIIGLSLVILVSGGAFFYQYSQRLKSISSERYKDKSITLIGPASQFCPNTARVVARDQQGTISEHKISIGDCRYISLDGFLAQKPPVTDLFVKIDKALAFKVNLQDAFTSRIGQQLNLGDVNDDNIIDRLDEELIKDAIFSRNDDFDLDRDGQVTVIDLGYVALNAGVGAEHPRQKSWSEQ